MQSTGLVARLLAPVVFIGGKLVQIDVLDELAEAGVAFNFTGSEEWISVKCAFHKDENPSCNINVKHGGFSCKGCEEKGSLAKFLAMYLNTDLSIIALKFATKYGESELEKAIDSSVYEGYHASISKAKPLLLELYKRGITDELIRKYRLGVDKKGRITIPILSESGAAVNIITYSPGARSKKFLSLPKRGSPVRLYPIEQLNFNKVLLCGGMTKAIVAAAELNQYGIGAISCTGGEQAKNWPPKLIKDISDNVNWVGICMDIDKVGVKASKDLAIKFVNQVDEVCIIELPLDKDKYPKGDVSDWIGIEKKKLKPLIDAAQLYTYETVEDEKNPDPISIKIQDVQKSVNIGKRVKFRAMVSAVTQDPYFLTKTVRVECNKEQDFCGVCPIYTRKSNDDGAVNISIKPENRQLLAMVDSEDSKLAAMYKEAIGIPLCKAVKFIQEEVYLAHNVLLAECVDEASVEDTVAVSAVSVGCNVKVGDTYDLIGKVESHPRTQRVVSILSEQTEAEDTLNNYKLLPEPLKIFQPKEWTKEGLAVKVKQIYDEFESHVTKIYKRQDLHLLFDLAWHSILHYKAEKRVNKGWVEVCVIGDSGQGKSDTSQGMLKHYGLGQRMDCKNASIAGMVGGLSQVAGQWYLSWGIFPSNDRRLIILEELKGMKPEVFSGLTDMRSSGKANVQKIQQGEKNARTRVIAISNPQGNLWVDSHSYGIEAIPDLIPNSEDVRRFDVFQILSKNEVDVNSISMTHMLNGDGKSIYTSEVCRKLILWGWSRTVDQVDFESWEHIITVSRDLCNRFTDRLPIIDKGSTRHKIARLSASLAVRTFSHGKNTEKVLVRNCHVDFIREYLIRIYTTEAFGYDRYTQKMAERAEIDVSALDQIFANRPDGKSIVENMLHKSVFTDGDMCDVFSVDGDSIRAVRASLVQARAIYREDKTNKYRKTSGFTKYLQILTTTIKGKPEFVSS